jgi:malic enzyme
MIASHSHGDVPAQRTTTTGANPLARSSAGRLAIVSDASTSHGDPSTGRGETFAVLEEATLLRDLTGLDAIAVPLTADNAGDLAAALRTLPAEINAIYLAHLDPPRARAVHADLANTDVVVVTEEHATATVLTAALLTVLRHADTQLSHSRVVIAGSDKMPLVSQIVIAAGVGDITCWRPIDGIAFPLRRIIAGTDAVIDLLGRNPRTPNDTYGHSHPPVITPHGPTYPLLAVPGLINGALHTHTTHLDIDAYHACALALADSTPHNQLLPSLLDPHIPPATAHAVAQALRHRRPIP